MSFSYSPKLVNSNLVFYLDPGNIKSYDNSNTTVIKDLSRTNYNFSISSGITFNSDNGGSIEYNGVNGYVRFPSTTAPNFDIGTDDYTWSGWLKFGGQTGQYRQIWYNSASGGVEGFGIYLLSVTNNIRTEVYGTTGGRQEINTVSVTNYLNEWHYWSFVLEQSSLTIKIYVDGVLISTGTALNSWGSIVKRSSQFPTLGSYAGSIFWYNGSMGAIQIYKKALTQDEVIKNYNSLKSRYQ